MRAGIAIGSNLGDRYGVLNQAILNIKLLHEEGEFLTSSFLHTEPQDCPPGSPEFLNAVVELETSLTPLDLLTKLRSLEAKAGRPEKHEFHAPRTLDLDILYCDDLTLHFDELQLPHPRITERYFVLKPLAEIRPDLILPGWSQCCENYLLNSNNKSTQ